MKKILISFVLCLIAVLPANAQKFYKDAISITDASLWQQGSSLYINMKIDMRDLKVDKDQILRLTPVLVGPDENIVLPGILVTGHQRQKAYIRAMVLNKADNMQMPYDTEKVLDYAQVIPYKAWMEKAHLSLEKDLCGCAGNEEIQTRETIVSEVSTCFKRFAALRPAFSYIQPRIEVVKSRSEHYEAYVDFPSGKSVIEPDFMNNQEELLNIRNIFSKIHNDEKLTITQIHIEGFASPEGSLASNERLSRSRADALKEYISEHEKVSANLFRTAFGGENWEGLAEALETSTLEEKAMLLDIIENTNDVAARKKKIQLVNGGASYRVLLKEIYPTLRKVDCLIDFTVANFNVDEGKEIVKSQPQYLSQNEMYQVANSYPKGSDDFNDVFDIAVRMYPDDEVANINAAAVALSRKDLPGARKYLDKSDKQTSEYTNNNGIYYLLSGDVEQAIAEFTKAAQNGNRNAQYNLAEIEKALKIKK